jgi:alpha-L-fucosidase 2
MSLPLKHFVLFSLLAFIQASVWAEKNAEIIASNSYTLLGTRLYELWEPYPAPNSGPNFDKPKFAAIPYDKDWESSSYPLGNGNMGACIFGRTDTDRIQLTEKSLYVDVRGIGSLSNFAELFLDFNHDKPTDYRRSLSLNDGTAHVSYVHKGIRYTREYFTSYPDNIMAIRLSADRPASLSLTVRPEFPDLSKYAANERTGKLTVNKDVITFAGTINNFSCNYEGQVKVTHKGGNLQLDPNTGTIKVCDADDVVLLIALGTNYRLTPHIFLTNVKKEKLDKTILPHDEVSSRIAKAEAMDYPLLRERHIQDHRKLFNRVDLRLASEPSSEPTNRQLELYRKGKDQRWMEELLFHYGRYLLIASSRPGTLPAGLQGGWNAYHWAPWTGGYWHNINIQMNYWGVMSANLPECFEAYIDYFNAYLPAAREVSRSVLKKIHGTPVDEKEDAGWVIGTSAGAYAITEPGYHSGPGVSGLTAKMLADYYLFSKDRDFLKNVAYPAMLSLSRFYSKALVEKGDLLMISPSASPENIVKDKSQVEGLPGYLLRGMHYVTAGTTFDQGMVWETYNDTLILAKELGASDPLLILIAAQMKRLDPILVGTSGQIKEYREERAYSDIGDPTHRHISHLHTLFPGTLINENHKEWMTAASVTLDKRGFAPVPWALAFRMLSRARLTEGDLALKAYEFMISNHVASNLWTVQPPFEIDANFGSMTGVIELLLQSHAGYIHLLPALPTAWANGSFKGLVARGNFEISANWKEGKIQMAAIHSRAGGVCRLRGGNFKILDANGEAVQWKKTENDCYEFLTRKGEIYTINL